MAKRKRYKKFKKKTQHLYKVTAKTRPTSNKYKVYSDPPLKTWSTSNLRWFTINHLDKNYPNWTWFNVFVREKDGTKGEQLGSFTKFNKPTKKTI